MVRVGVIGAGRFGRHYLRIIQHTEGVSLAAVASSNPETGALVPQGCPVTSDWRTLMSRDALDAVIIATPPQLHYEMASAAMRAGLAVLVEKPVTLDPPQAQALYEEAVQTGAVALVNHIQVINPAWQALKANLPRIGAVADVISEGGNHGPFRPDTPPWWDYGSHDVSLVLDLFRVMPDAVSARILTRQPVAGATEAMNVEAMLRFGSVTATLRCGNLYEAKIRRITVRGEHGTLEADDLRPHKVMFYGVDDAATPLPYDATPPLDATVQRLRDAVRHKTPNTEDMALGRDVVTVLARTEALLPQ